MVYPEGTAKEMRAILEERGVYTKGMKAQDMRNKLKTYLDFQNQKTLLEKLIEGQGHLCHFTSSSIVNLVPLNVCGATLRSTHEHRQMAPSHAYDRLYHKDCTV